LWESLRAASTSPLFQDAEDAKLPLSLPAMEGREEVFADYQTTGLSLKAHPISFFRQQLDELHIAPASRLASLPDGCFVRVGGLVLVRQRPGTARGITFVTIENETGVANLIIRMDVWERFYRIARAAPAYIAGGRLQNQKGVIHVLVSRLENMNETLHALRSSSRNFH
jgi:error-prone DNA polymerase